MHIEWFFRNYYILLCSNSADQDIEPFQNVHIDYVSVSQLRILILCIHSTMTLRSFAAINVFISSMLIWAQIWVQHKCSCQVQGPYLWNYLPLDLLWSVVLICVLGHADVGTLEQMHSPCINFLCALDPNVVKLISCEVFFSRYWERCIQSDTCFSSFTI